MARISVVRGDPDFTNEGPRYKVLFDGVEQTHCIMADDTLGIIRRYKKNKLGILAREQGNLVMEELCGNVVISKRDI